MKKIIFVSSLVIITSAHAESQKSDNEFMYMADITSDYRFRGISQTRLKPAVQAGIDYTNNPTGLYAGTWATNIKWVSDAGGDAKLEWDVYGGKRGNITDDINYDVGFIKYIYPSNKLQNVNGFENADTTEIYAQLGYGPVYIKYSNSLTNLFGFMDSKHSSYLDAGANIKISDEITLNLHAGHQEVENNSMANYDDWKIGITKDFDFASLSLAAIGTNADKMMYASPVNGKFTGKTSLVVTLTKMF